MSVAIFDGISKDVEPDVSNVMTVQMFCKKRVCKKEENKEQTK